MSTAEMEIREAPHTWPCRCRACRSAKNARNEQVRQAVAEGAPRDELAERFGVRPQEIDRIASARPALTDQAEGMDISRQLAELRDVLNPSYTVLSEETDINRSVLKQLSAANHFATPHTRRKIVEALSKRRDRLSEIIFALEVDG